MSPAPEWLLAGRVGRPHGLDGSFHVTQPNAQLLDAAAAAGEIRPDMDAYGLLRGIGNLCAGVDGDSRYDARRMVGLLISGLRLR